MLKNIREIGIFMIAAQTVIHFAPGKQYEKYIKSVSGIIILLLFLRPFLQLSGAEWKDPQAAMEKLEELTNMPEFSALEKDVEEDLSRMGADMDSAVISRMEAEVKELLNRELEGEEYRVRRVSIRFAKDPARESELCLSQIEIGMEKSAEREEERQIGIDRIVIGEATDSEEENAFLQYRRRFAGILGIEEERLEVRRDGRG